MLEKQVREYFDNISTYKDIKSFVANRTQEGIYLDFKLYKGDEKSLKISLCRAASGFAHQYGGIIIWGVSAKKTNQGDHAEKLEPIENLGNFLTLLNQYSRDAIVPHLQIIHEPIYLNDSSAENKGFVKSFFPSSDDLHRACFDGRYNFYRRFGESHVPIHTKEEMINLLNRKKEPKLRLKISSELKEFAKDQNGEVISGKKKVLFWLKNSGNEVAEFPSFLIETTMPLSSFYDSQGGTTFPLGDFVPVPGKSSMQFIPKAGFVIHPSQEILVGSTSFNKLSDFEISYKCFAKNMNMFEDKAIV